MAIMGASGSGKTTLLDVLNFRNKMKVSGLVAINGQQIRSEKSLSFVSAYVTQQDLFFDTLTVKEHLTFHVS
jgi:ABC-type multidrug transport system ATPase subunit